jgi:hypothetical protein
MTTLSTWRAGAAFRQRERPDGSHATQADADTVIVRRGVVLARASTRGKTVCAAVPTDASLKAYASVAVQ